MTNIERTKLITKYKTHGILLNFNQCTWLC